MDVSGATHVYELFSHPVRVEKPMNVTGLGQRPAAIRPPHDKAGERVLTYDHDERVCVVSSSAKLIDDSPGCQATVERSQDRARSWTSLFGRDDEPMPMLGMLCI